MCDFGQPHHHDHKDAKPYPQNLFRGHNRFLLQKEKEEGYSKSQEKRSSARHPFEVESFMSQWMVHQ